MIKYLLPLFSLILFLGCGDSKEVQLIKTGHFTDHPSKTIGDAVNGFFKNPSWESGMSAGS